mgnify:CR=1 FL=1
MFNYELEQSIKEKYLQVCRNLTWRIRINFNKNTNILLERYEILREFIIITRKIVNFIKFHTRLFNKSIHKNYESILFMKLFAKL